MSQMVNIVLMFKLCRPEGSGEIKYAESSMMNGFGLKYIYRFFNLPFLTLQVSKAFLIGTANMLSVEHRIIEELRINYTGLSDVLYILQREALLRQLETNRMGMQAVVEELALHEDSEEQNYEV